MSSPFDSDDGIFFVLVNHEGQYSIWPEFCDIPDGWTGVYGPVVKDECLKYVEDNWLDMRPRTLIENQTT